MPDRYTSIIDAHVLLWRDSRLLLLRRAGNVFATGKLCLPSGHLEKDESIVGTAIRETHEETGISLDPSGLNMVLTVHRRNPDGHTRFGFFFSHAAGPGYPPTVSPANTLNLSGPILPPSPWTRSTTPPPPSQRSAGASTSSSTDGRRKFAAINLPEKPTLPNPTR